MELWLVMMWFRTWYAFIVGFTGKLVGGVFYLEYLSVGCNVKPENYKEFISTERWYYLELHKASWRIMGLIQKELVVTEESTGFTSPGDENNGDGRIAWRVSHVGTHELCPFRVVYQVKLLL